MTDTIRALLADCGREAERKAARIAWAKATAAAWHEAMLQMDERCTEAVERLSEKEFDRLFEAEQVKVDAIYLMRQLGYEDTDKEKLLRLLESVRRFVEERT